MALIKDYKIRVTPYHTITVEAANYAEALLKAWAEIKDGYRYGYKNFEEFKKGAKWG